MVVKHSCADILTRASFVSQDVDYSYIDKIKAFDSELS